MGNKLVVMILEKQHQFLNVELILNGMILISLKMTEKTLLLLEVVYQTSDEKGDFFCACSCKIKGKACDHIISACFLKKNLVKPSEEPSISRFAKSKGRLPNARKQIRY